MVGAPPSRKPASLGLRWALALLLATLSAPGHAVTGGVQGLVNALGSYADGADPASLERYLHRQVADCVNDLEAHAIARFVLVRVRKQGLPGKLETRAVADEEVRQLEQQARKMHMSMPVAPTRELRLVYDDYTARFFLAEQDGELRWVLPCAE